MRKIAIFGSGTGTNAKRIIEQFRNNGRVDVALILSNKPGTGILSIAEKENIPSLILEKERFFRGDAYVPLLREKKIELVVLAGFLWKIPAPLIDAFPGKIINLHPALLPKFGGKGMYGLHVHQAVIDQKEKESGITIHYVDEHYDNGDIILQVKCPVLENDTAESLARRVQELEHSYFPVVVEKILKGE